jgi:LysM domain
MSTPYTVRPGDYLVKIARDNGFKSWQQIYWHPDNKALRAKRHNPDRIFAGDVIMIPDGPPPVAAPLGGGPQRPTPGLGPLTPDISGIGPGVLDIGGAAIGVVTTIADFGEALGALEAAGTLGSVFSPILESIGTILVLLAAWAAADAFARFNGSCDGFWNAMQDMADAFGDSSLDTKPLSEWPAIPVPQPHFGKTPEDRLLTDELEFRHGQQEGAMKAFQLAQQMETNPREFPAVIGGQKTAVKLTGKQWLRALKKMKGKSGEISSFIHAEIDKQLKAQGHPEWPTWK